MVIGVSRFAILYSNLPSEAGPDWVWRRLNGNVGFDAPIMWSSLENAFDVLRLQKEFFVWTTNMGTILIFNHSCQNRNWIVHWFLNFLCTVYLKIHEHSIKFIMLERKWMKETKDQKDPCFFFKLNKQNLVMFRNSKRLRLRLVTVFVFYFQKLFLGI